MARARFGAQVACTKKLTAMCTGDPWIGVMAAIGVRDLNRRSSSLVEPTIASGTQCEHDVGEILPLFTKSVLVARRVFLVHNTLENALANESLESVRNDGLLGTAVFHEV